MIKYINDGEIKLLKSGFYNCLRLKKLQYMPIEEFKRGEVSFEVAEEIFRLLTSFNNLHIVEGYIGIMLEYLLNNDKICNNDYERIINSFYDESIVEYGDIDDYGDCVDDRIEFLDDFFKKLCESAKVEYSSASFFDIYYGDEPDEVFNDLKSTLQSYSGSINENEDEDDELEDYYSLFQDDATSFVLINYKIDGRSLVMLNKVLDYACEAGIQSEAYVKEGNTYITISSMAIYEGIGYSFFIAMILILSHKNK